MENRIHPTFQKTFQKRFIAIWLIGAIGFGSGIYFYKTGHATLGLAMFLVCAVSIFGGLAQLTYLLFHVTCLTCKGKTRTQKDSTKEKWVANCERCQTQWDLQIGTGAD